MTRISPPCSSSGRRGRAPARLEWRVPRPAPPSPPPRRPDTPSARPAAACRGIPGSGAVPPWSGSFLNELDQVRRQRRLRFASYHHALPFFLDDDLLTCLALVGVRVVAAGMSAAAFGSPSAARAVASETTSRDRRSIAVCQPGLYSRLPPIPTFRA